MASTAEVAKRRRESTRHRDRVLASAKYKEGDIVLAFHGPLLYEAKVLEVGVDKEGALYNIHYMGWNKKWDEWVGENRLKSKSSDSVNEQEELVARLIQTNTSVANSKSVTSLLGQGVSAHRRARQVLQKLENKGIIAVDSNKRRRTENSSSSNAADIHTLSYPSSSSSSSPVASSSANGDGGAPTMMSATSFAGTGSSFTSRPTSASPSAVKGVMAGGRVAMKLTFPRALRKRVTDDWERITRDGTVCRLPRTPSVATILHMFLTTKRGQRRSKRSQRAVKEMCDGLEKYFDKVLETKLLYDTERVQLTAVKRATPEGEAFVPASVYGAEHLLRLLVKLPYLLLYTNIQEDALALLKAKLGELMRWMVRVQDDIFVGGYILMLNAGQRDDGDKAAVAVTDSAGAASDGGGVVAKATESAPAVESAPVAQSAPAAESAPVAASAPVVEAAVPAAMVVNSDSDGTDED